MKLIFTKYNFTIARDPDCSGMCCGSSTRWGLPYKTKKSIVKKSDQKIVEKKIIIWNLFVCFLFKLHYLRQCLPDIMIWLAQILDGLHVIWLATIDWEIIFIIGTAADFAKFEMAKPQMFFNKWWARPMSRRQQKIWSNALCSPEL